jgi:outer membrane murein-binding lipoprotein Lpp
MNGSEPLASQVNQPKATSQARRPRSWDWLFRLAIVILLAGSAAWACWRLGRLELLQRQSRQLSSTITRLSAQVDELEGKWARGQADEIGNQLKQARARLFSDQAALEHWIRALKEQAEPLFLEAKTSFGKTVPLNAAEQELAMIPATISLDVGPADETGQSASPYRRLVQLSQSLARQEKRADLVEMTVEGGTNSVASAVLVLHLWAGVEARP